MAFKSMLRRKGIRVVSITEQADDTPTGRLLEAIIESVDEFYSENLAQEVTRGMREAASRGFFLASRAPFGYKRIKVKDGAKERPTLEVDTAAAPVVKEIFQSSLMGAGLKEICKQLNDRGITNRADAGTRAVLPIFSATRPIQARQCGVGPARGRMPKTRFEWKEPGPPWSPERCSTPCSRA